MAAFAEEPAEEKKAPPLDEPNNTSVEINKETSTEDHKTYTCQPTKEKLPKWELFLYRGM